MRPLVNEMVRRLTNNGRLSRDRLLSVLRRIISISVILRRLALPQKREKFKQSIIQ